MSNYLTRMGRGLNYLDVNVKGWASMVDLGVLDMSSNDACVLAQIFPAEYFINSVELLMEEAGEVFLDLDLYEWATEHGFDCFDDFIERADEMWAIEIMARL